MTGLLWIAGAWLGSTFVVAVTLNLFVLCRVLSVRLPTALSVLFHVLLNGR